MSTHKESLRHGQRMAASYAKAAPELCNGFSHLHEAACAPGALDLKTKELIAIGISVSVHCVFCFQSHITSALKAGASKEEITEAIGVGILMGGGPAYAYAIQAYECLEELTNDKN
ncbi:hypothetical protein ABB02_01989 [Clostridiaceae bacterium JG1575]|nr:hypothetical protein ABB02_01989 [Clostridiaceae bacterium JG1575]